MAVLGQRADELLEGLHDIVEGGVEVRVVELDVRDHGGLWPEVEERTVALVRLGHDEVGPPEGDVAADVVQFAAYQGRRALAQSLEDVRRHARRRRLAVGSCHGDAAATLEDPGEGCGARDNGDRPTPGLQELRVRRWYGRRDHHTVCVPYLVRGVPDVDGDARLTQPAGVRRLLEIRARDAVTSSGQDLGDPTHSRPADADHVYVHAPNLLLSGTQQSPGYFTCRTRRSERALCAGQAPPAVHRRPTGLRRGREVYARRPRSLASTPRPPRR